jgi:hypothetical protein
MAAPCDNAQSIMLLVLDNDYYKTFTVNYRGALRNE